MKEITMTEEDQNAFQQALGYTKDWCSEHQWEIGAAEMALGAAAITWGIQHGVIEMGIDLVANAFGQGSLAQEISGLVGAGIGGAGGAILGTIGVCGLPIIGTAFAIPAAVLAGGGAIFLGAAGYTIGDLCHKFLNPPVNPTEFFGHASVLAVGVALLIDGARRVVKDRRILKQASKLKNGVLYLRKSSSVIVAKSIDELKVIVRSLAVTPKDKIDATGSLTSGAAVAAAGTAVGGSLAASSVSVLGSQALGSAALSLGLVSAPVWPLIAGGAAGMAVGYGAWKTIRHFTH